MRINRYLAMCNLGSRREVEELIVKGKISVNGEPCQDLATDINIGVDEVTFENRVVTPVEEKIYLALNKPRGYLVTRSDEFDRQTVFDLLPKFEVNLFAVGRLDKDSEGLLLLTNDGDFAEKIMHPRYKLAKIYKVEVQGYLKKEDLQKLQNGILLEGEMTQPARIFIKKSDATSTILRFTIYEGKNRQIRKMLEVLGYQVIHLKRLQIAGIKLNDLPSGLFRPLKPREINSILNEKEMEKREAPAKRRRIRSTEPQRDRSPYKTSTLRKERKSTEFYEEPTRRPGRREGDDRPYSRDQKRGEYSARPEKGYERREGEDRPYSRDRRREPSPTGATGRYSRRDEGERSYSSRTNRDESTSRQGGRYRSSEDKERPYPRDQKRGEYSARPEKAYERKEGEDRPYSRDRRREPSPTGATGRYSRRDEGERSYSSRTNRDESTSRQGGRYRSSEDKERPYPREQKRGSYKPETEERGNRSRYQKERPATREERSFGERGSGRNRKNPYQREGSAASSPRGKSYRATSTDKRKETSFKPRKRVNKGYK